MPRNIPVLRGDPFWMLLLNGNNSLVNTVAYSVNRVESLLTSKPELSDMVYCLIMWFWISHFNNYTS